MRRYIYSFYLNFNITEYNEVSIVVNFEIITKYENGTLELFLNGEELSLNSVNSGNLINH